MIKKKPIVSVIGYESDLAFLTEDGIEKVILKKTSDDVLSRAQGDYVYFLKPGERMAPDAFALLSRVVKKSKSDMLGFGVSLINAEGILFHKNQGLTFDYLPAEFTGRTFSGIEAISFMKDMRETPFLYKRSFAMRLTLSPNDPLFYDEAVLKASKIDLVCDNFSTQIKSADGDVDVLSFYEKQELLFKKAGLFKTTKIILLKNAVRDLFEGFITCPRDRKKDFETGVKAYLKSHPLTSKTKSDLDEETIRLYDWLSHPPKGPAVSIVSPVHNTAVYLPEFLASIHNQTVQDYELILVDDGSEDDSLQILTEAAAHDPRLHVISQSAQGAAAARNAGLEKAEGQYVVFLDSDDFFDPNLLLKTYTNAIQNDTDVTSFPLQRYDESTGSVVGRPYGAPILSKNAVSSRMDNPARFFFLVPTNIAKLYKRSFVLDKDIRFQTLTCFNDVYFVFVAFAKASRISVVTEPLYFYRYNRQENTSSVRQKNLLNLIEAMDAVERTLSKEPDWEGMKNDFLACKFSTWINRLKAHFYEANARDFYRVIRERLHQLPLDELQFLINYQTLSHDFYVVLNYPYVRAKYFAPAFQGNLAIQRMPKTTSFKIRRMLLFFLLLPYFLYTAHQEAVRSIKTQKPKVKKSFPKELQVAPVFGKSAVTLVFATDANYVPYLSTALQSILEHASRKRKYDIIVLEENVTDQDKDFLRLQVQPFKNISLRFYSMEPIVEEIGRSIFVCFRHLSVAAFFRLFIPRIFAQYRKILYLDCDVAFLTDVAKLYKIGIGKNYLGAAPSAHHLQAKDPFAALDRKRYVTEVLGMSSVDNYFFSGGLIYNIPLMNKNNLQEKFIEKLKELKDPIAHDQDVLNAVCEGHVHFLDITWNYPYNVIESHYYYRVMRYNRKHVWEKYLNASKHIKQVHFYTIEKPWDFPNRKLAPYFWEYARKTPFYERILLNSKANGKPETSTPLPDPKLSVIIYVRNMQGVLKDCLESCLKQTMHPVEFICIDDHSTDESFALCCQYAKKDNRFYPLESEGVGQIAAKKMGLEEARGEYVAFIDGNNLYAHHQILEGLCALADRNDANVCGGRAAQLNKQVVSYTPDEAFVFQNRWAYASEYQTCFGYQRFIYRRDFLQKNHLTFDGLEPFDDRLFLAKTIRKAKKILAVTDVVLINRYTPAKISWTLETAQNYFDATRQMLAFAHSKRLWKLQANVYWDFMKNQRYLTDMLPLWTLADFRKQIEKVLKNVSFRKVKKHIPADQLITSALPLMRGPLKGSHPFAPKTVPQQRLYVISVHLVEHCNLHCKYCAHFSPLAKEEFYSIDTFERDMKQLSKLLKGELNCLGLMGGEPLLHPQLPQILKIARTYFPNTNLELISNGILLDKMDEKFWNACRRYDVSVECTKYPIKVDYDHLAQIAKDHGVFFDFYGGTRNIVKTVRHTPLDLTGSQDMYEMFQKCFLANNCCFLANGRLFTCTIAPNIVHFNRFFGKDVPLTEQDSIDIHTAKNGREVIEFMAEPIPFCKYCQVDRRDPGRVWKTSKHTIDEWT